MTADLEPGHLDDEALAAWADGRCSPAQAEQLTAHVAACAECRKLASHVMRRAGGDAQSKFRRVRMIGSGGMGEVWEVVHALTHHHRALKLLHHRYAEDAQIVERFVREASAAGRIKNPHIVESFDAGRLEDGTPYVLMELLVGESLSSFIRRLGRLSPGLTAGLLVQCCEALQAAHDAGIIHRDLKPGNLFVVTVDGAPFIKVLDFGMSKFDPGRTGELSVTEQGMALGTPLYMSPEQMGGSPVDARSDVYALGVIAWECLVGENPYPRTSFPELAAAVYSGKVAAPHTLVPAVPPQLSAAVMKAMAAAPEARFPSAAALAAALRPFVLAEAAAPKQAPASRAGLAAAAVALAAAAAAGWWVASSPHVDPRPTEGAADAGLERAAVVSLPDRDAGPAVVTPAAATFDAGARAGRLRGADAGLKCRPDAPCAADLIDSF